MTSPRPLRLFNPLLSPSSRGTSSLSPPLPLAIASLPASTTPTSPLLPSPPLLCLSFGFARCAVSAMGIACGKAAVDPPPTAIGQYYTSRLTPPQPPATNIHYASSYTPSASPAPGTASTANSGIIIYPIYETSSPIVSRRVDISGFRVKTSFDAGTDAAVDLTAAHTTVDAHMLKQQMQVLSRLKGQNNSGRESVSDGNGTVMAACRTESNSVSLEVRVV